MAQQKSLITIILLICVTVSGTTSLYSAECDVSIIPLIGYSQPLSDQSERWNGGYVVGLEGFSSCSGAIHYGARISYQRWNVNAEDMLMINGHDMRIERRDGSRALGELSILARYEVSALATSMFSLALDGGVGAFYLRTAPVELKGFYNLNFYNEETNEWRYVAVNREISLEPEAEVAPGFNLGLTMMINEIVQPSLRVQHIFSADDGGMTTLMVSVGILAH